MRDRMGSEVSWFVSMAEMGMVTKVRATRTMKITGRQIKRRFRESVIGFLVIFLKIILFPCMIRWHSLLRLFEGRKQSHEMP